MTQELQPCEKMSAERWRKIAASRRLPSIFDTPEARVQLRPVIERAIERMEKRRAGVR